MIVSWQIFVSYQLLSELTLFLLGVDRAEPEELELSLESEDTLDALLGARLTGTKEESDDEDEDEDERPEEEDSYSFLLRLTSLAFVATLGLGYYFFLGVSEEDLLLFLRLLSFLSRLRSLL